MLKTTKKCKKKHLIECPDFAENKKCPRGKLCPLMHRVKKAAKIIKRETSSLSDSIKSENQEFGASFILFEDKQQTSLNSLSSS